MAVRLDCVGCASTDVRFRTPSALCPYCWARWFVVDYCHVEPDSSVYITAMYKAFAVAIKMPVG